MDELAYALIFAVLGCALLAALVLPAPARAVRNEAGVHQALLVAGSLATLVTGLLALQDRPIESAVCGAIAWLIVMPCVWLVRAPRAAGGWDDEEDDDDGGAPPPHRPPSPRAPAPDPGLCGLRPAPAAAGAAFAAPRAAAAAIAATTAQHLPPGAAPTSLPAAALPPGAAPAHTPLRRRLTRRPRRTRGDHRSIVHVRTAEPHAGRRRRAMARRQVLRRCRLWFFPPAPPCEPLPGRRHVAPAHERSAARHD